MVSDWLNSVGVGIVIAHNPLHGSGVAAFPHPALALGDDAGAPQGIGMTDRRQRQPASDETPHARQPRAAAIVLPVGLAVKSRTFYEREAIARGYVEQVPVMKPHRYAPDRTWYRERKPGKYTLSIHQMSVRGWGRKLT
jgi:hypothetical protein